MYELKRILVPISFAPSCYKAIDVAVRLAMANNAKIYFLYVYKTPMRLYNFGGALYSELDVERAENIKRLDEYVRNKLKKLSSKLEIEELEVEGRPEDAIRKVAIDKKADLIVLGHHEESRLEHLLFGRNINKIVDNAPCDVIVTKTYLYKRKSEGLAA